MITYILLVSLLFYYLFYKEIKDTHYILLLLLICRLMYLIYYISVQDNYIGLSDDFVYYSVGSDLLRDTPYELFTYDMRLAYILSMGQHILFGVLNFLVYYYFGQNIFNMLLFNFVIYILGLYIMKLLVFKLTNNNRLTVLFTCVYLVYPDFIALSILNLKEYVVLLLFVLVCFSTVNIFTSRGKSVVIICKLLLLITALNFIFYIRFYLIVLYLVSIAIYVLVKCRVISLKIFLIFSMLMLLPFLKGLYDFMFSPFFLTVDPQYYFYKLPAFFNWLIIFPLTFYGFIRKFNKIELLWLIIFTFVILLFYGLFGAPAGLVGPRQRLFIEPIYVLFFSYAILLIFDEKKITCFGCSFRI